MIRRNLFLSLAVASFLLTSCKDDSGERDTIETDPIAFQKEGELSLIKPDGDTIQQLDIEIADNDYEHETGLMYRESMEKDQGMLFIYDDEAPRAFYMKNTTIPLDIIFYGSDSTAVSFQENAEPMKEESLPSGVPAQFVLEVNAGLVEEWNIEEGDKIYFTRMD